MNMNKATLIEEILDCHEDRSISVEYIWAIRKNDIEKLRFFESMGDDARKRIMNVCDYRQGLIFGFTEIKFNECGWLDNVEWDNYEKVEINVCKKHDKYFVGNTIDLAMGKNGLWVYSLHYKFGSSGGGWGCNIYRNLHKSRIEALNAGAKDLYDKHLRALEINDKSNFHHDYSKKVIKWIEENYFKEAKNNQLELFI